MSFNRGKLARPAQASMLLLALCCTLNSAYARPSLPVACAAGACGALPFTPSMNPGAGLPQTVGNTMTVTQVDQRQIFNWSSFNIDKGYGVNFQQPNAAASALNRIYDANPSEISGSLTGNGQIVLINSNGIIFHNGAQVNVGSLVASSLDLQDKDFLNPTFYQTLTGGSLPAFMGSSGLIHVDAGATLTSAKGGSIWLFAPTVTNNGLIQTEEGQIILAAGHSVYLQASDDPSLRGFLVEVDNGGAARNMNLGQIIATRGNATLVGIAVNQSGRISATTSATLNGSIRLLARDSVSPAPTLIASNTSANGQVDENGLALAPGVTLGANSVTSVLPELGNGQTLADSQTFMQSKIDIYGHSIQVQDNALVRAPDGLINFTAALNPSDAQAFTNPVATVVPDVHVYFAPGSVVDASGTQNVSLAMESNSIQVNLQGAQLADAPLQHNGFLKGQTVWVDVRTAGDGKLPVADISGYLGQIQRTVDEKTTTGGTVTVQSQGDIVMRAGSRIDVSGGSVNYSSGYVKSAQLLSQGQAYNFATAPANRIYDGVAGTYTVTDPKWGVTRSWTTPAAQTGRYEPGYVEGKPAGQIKLLGFAYALDGQLLGQRTTGALQQASAKLPTAGTLQIGSNGGRAFTPAIDFATGSTLLPAGYQPGDPLPNQLTISTDALRQGGFGQLLVYSGGRIHLPKDVNLALPDDGSLTLTGVQVAVDGNITLHGGSVSLAAKEVTPVQAAQTGLSLGDGAQIDVSGLWVNDRPNIAGENPNGPLAINGGKVALSSQLGLDLKPGSVVDVSGGGWLNASGKVQAGNAGSITLRANQAARTGDPSGALHLEGTLSGNALGQGGALSISTPNVRIGTGLVSAPDSFTLDPGFFGQAGFENYSIDGQQQLEVLAGSVIAPVAQNRVLDASYTLRPTGSRLADFSYLQAQPMELRRPVSLTLTALGGITPGQAGTLRIGQGAVIRTDPGSTIKLSAAQLLDVNGTLEAPGGSITLTQAEGLDRGTALSFSDQAGIWLGSQARLLAPGYARILPDRKGARTGSVLSGGSVNIAASNGYVMTDPAALIDVSGSSGSVAQLPGSSVYLAQPATIGGDAGSVVISATEGLVLNARLQGGVAVAGTRSGQLGVSMDNNNFNRAFAGGYPLGDRTLVITENNTDLPTAAGVGTPVPNSYNGKAYVAADRLRSSGFGAVTLSAEDKIQFASSLNLTGFARSLTLDTPALEASGAFNVNLAAPYLTLANSRNWQQASGSPAAGSALLNASATQNIDLLGSINLRGFAASSFNTPADIRLIGAAASPTDQLRTGQLASVGDLSFTARQIYPTTLTDFALRIQDNPLGTIAIERAQDANGAPVPDVPVLSAGGTLTLQAPTIRQSGVVKAPLGVITLDAGDYESGVNGLARVADGNLTLGAQSISSVSLENQLVPYGSVENSTLWQYGLAAALKRNIVLPPEKRIELKGANVNVAAGASVNLSGGGDLYAAEFLAGPGGSRDVLADPTMFAVIPALGNNVAPFDFQYASGTSLKPGDSVYLSGGAGLKPGMYTLLPGQYALLPGAFAVQLVPGKSVIPDQALALIDGSALSSGYRLVAGTGMHDSGWSGYVVMPQAIVRNLAQYQNYSANNFFGQTSSDHPVAPRLPQDAGQLILAATQNLSLAPDAVAMTASGAGRGGLLDVVAPKIAVVDTSGSFAGYLELTADSLSNMGAASILLGGRRTTTADGVSIQVGASEVAVANNAAAPLSAPDLILAAQDHVSIADGSVITASGNTGSDQSVLHVDGPGALLRVTSGTQARVERAAAGTGAGLLTVGANTRLTGNSLLFDATGDTTIAATAKLAAQAVSLSSSKIALGNSPGGVGGLNLTTALLQQVESAADLTLHSYSTLDIYQNAGFDLTQRVDSQGNPLVSSLTLDTGAIVSHLAPGQNEELVAHQISLRNSGAAVSASGSNAGELTLTAKELDLPVGTATKQGTGTLALQDGAQSITGFSQVKLNAGTQIVASGNGSLNTENATLTLESPRVTASDKADYIIDAGSGAVKIIQPVAAAALPDTSSLGAKLLIRGGSIAQLGRIAMRGGALTLNATQGDVVLGSGVATDPQSLTDASGWAEHFADQTRYYPGGKVTLQADQGNVYVKSGAMVDVSGASDSNGSGAAGTLSVSASQGIAEFAEGSIIGKATGSAASGSFDLDVGALNLDAAGNNRFIALNRALEAGGFHQSRTLRVRSGDVTIPLMQQLDAGGNVIKDAGGNDVVLPASARDFSLTTDAGSITVAGQVNASGAQGGHIALNAQQDITVVPGARLDVSATDAAGVGGTIALQSSDGTIDLKPGSTFAAAGAAGNGDVRLRAKRNAGNSDVQIAQLGAAFSNVNSVLLEAYQKYSSPGTIAAADFGATSTWYTDAANFMANTATIKNRLGVTSDSRIQLATGIEVQSSGDMTLADDWSLYGWRYDPVTGAVTSSTTGQNAVGQNLVAGVLTLRAGGNLNLNGSLSDGFSTASTSSAMQGINSWSYRLVAGADTTRPDLGAVQSGVGDVTLAADKLVRTGTGFINVSAGRDVKLLDQTSVIYTAGHNTPRLPDYPTLGAPYSKNAYFPTGGGDIAIQAGRDIVAAPESQLFTPWLYRVGALNADGTINTKSRTTWWTSFPDFKQGVGALGGGNVTVAAERDINNLGVVAPTNGRLAGAANTIPDPANLLVQGGGNLLITAGRDINSGLFYVAHGTGTVHAGGSLGSARQGIGQNVYTILGLGDGHFDITANGDLNLETVVNPTVLPQGSNNTTASVFSTYGADSAVNLVSLNGNVIFANHQTAKISNAFSSIPNATHDSFFQFYPGRLEATALQGDIQLGGPIILMPTASGTLDFLAADSILLQSTVVVSGANPDLLPTPLHPAATAAGIDQLAQPAIQVAENLPGTPVHQNTDSELAYLVARDGDILGNGFDYSAILATPAWIEAGRDIKDIRLQVENHDVNTLSTVRAGRDIVYSQLLDPLTGNVQSNNQSLAVSGPGRFEVLAGRNIDLGGSSGIISRGNLDVTNLPEKGADLYVLAGLGQTADGRVRLPDYQAFTRRYFDGSATGQQALQDFFANVERQLRLNQSLTEADVQQQLAAYRSRFDTMALSEKALQVFFSELRQGGKQGHAGNYQRGYQAIASLFPAGYQGNINLFNSQIKTESGGDINLLAPGGLVNVGLAKPGNTKSPSDQGIFTESGGVIRSFSSGDFLVNQSRVFTLQGDDLLLWSTQGNIDAGKGSKTASATPPPRLVFKNGVQVLDTSNVVSGSGIGQLLARSGYKAGEVDLIAPQGEVNAGEAGISVAGDLLIAAQRVIGANNIQVGGISVGVPVAPSTSLAGLTGTGLSDASQAAGNTAKTLGSNNTSEDTLKNIKQALSGLQTSFISVDLVGFGPTGQSNGLTEAEKNRK
ncbi:filamentous haemagglutinin family outer membrane protein associated with VreARI signalling system [Sulfuriferula multivorans]|uniref:Filamentous haemagglutinin family outer membrane protein associated with VreARI signalling system n=1 Tax=Sulfuriferula multivorans TaxID=1559896 RepID=A0A401JBT6_9PROT|nr:filamentous haemagglutinin family protein [Sulfuriferula multivorans]GBL45121.1 filamentous haemagglutinin family outer membrane protein associated with VreARI signalling system [Sulfuriferula multivorans]